MSDKPIKLALLTEFAEGARITLGMTIDNQYVAKYNSRSLSIFAKERGRQPIQHQ